MPAITRTFLEIARLVFVLWLVSVLAFLALRLTPGDPAVLLLGPQAGHEDAEALLAQVRTEMGFDQPWIVQYGIWIGDILRGDFGNSSRSGVSVLSLIVNAVPPTLWLVLLSVMVSVPLSIAIGMWAASHRNGAVDRGVRVVTTMSIAIPGVWLGLILIIFFSVNLGVLPSGGYVSPLIDPGGFIRHMILPVATLSVFLTGVLTRFVYAEGSDVLRQDYMRTATAMGIPRRTRIFRYATRNAVLPMITIVGVQIGVLVGNAVLVEAVFGIGGLGQLLLSSVLNRDYQVVQGAVLITTVVVVLVGFLSDMANRLIDPRIAK
ncbi:ABC transporter permease [Garicola koreensis]|uniref:Peptide/nickel transport system permease protein n=1 Tax=Garicola koreensis TaxID=1262554 RepID=A0A7W5TNB8_9MICC|nr:ABC transporter permease [Garicola koreensis]MBB3666510.1 peptide/nickel transport system permease protein [Garicola koreensis]